MRFLDRVDISGSVNMASLAKDSFIIGTPLENNDGNVDNLEVHANADFKNNVILGSSSTDTVVSNAAFTASSGITINNNSSLNIIGSGKLYYNGSDVLASIENSNNSYADQVVQQISQSLSQYGGGAGSYLSGTSIRDASNSGQGQIQIGHLSASGYGTNDDIISFTNGNSRITMLSGDIKFEFLNSNQLLISDVYNALNGSGSNNNNNSGGSLSSVQSTGSGASLVRDVNNGTAYLRSIKSTSTINVNQQTDEVEIVVNPNLTLTSLTSQGTLVVSGNVQLGDQSSDTVTVSGQTTINNNLSVSGNIAATGSLNVQGLRTNYYLTSPNATTPVIAIEATGSTTNVDLALVPKGANAALITAVPDGTAAGGNKRGIKAIDIQLGRGYASQVASGEASAIIGGQSNTATGYIGSSIGGQNNQNYSQGGSMLGGANGIIYSVNYYGSIFGGASNVIKAGAHTSQIFGGSTNTIEANSEGGTVYGGYGNVVDAVYAEASGLYAKTFNTYGRSVYSGGRFSTTGDAQTSTLLTRGTTTNATASILTSNNVAAQQNTTGSNTLQIPNNSTYMVRAQVVARESSTAVSKGWTLECLATRGANAASTTIDGSVVSSSFGTNVSASAWSATLVANTTRGAIEVQVTGEASKTIKWVATLTTTEVTG